MRIYIWSNAVNTGGPEALHQLADSCVRQGLDCHLYYEDQRTEVPAQFECYKNIRVTQRIPDEADCVVVLPEVCTPLVSRFHHAQVVFWWLSVDNNAGQFADFANDKIIHAYQSEYARQYVSERGASRCYALFDYVNDFYRGQSVEVGEKLNIVSFNPRKGFEIAKHIVGAMCHAYAFAPLAGMTREQVRRLLRLSKVYIDFGSHPGKDRIPREAALMGNCIVVGKLGAAANELDVPIPAELKFDIAVDRQAGKISLDLGAIVSRIDHLMKNYEESVRCLEGYLSGIDKEKEEFDQQTRALFAACCQ